MKVLYAGEPATRPAFSNPDTDDFITVPFERHELEAHLRECNEESLVQR